MTQVAQRKPLGQLLLGKGLIGADQLDLALREQRRSRHQKLLGEVLVEMRHCTNAQIVQVLAEAHGVPFVRVSQRLVDPQVARLLPTVLLRQLRVLPLDVAGQAVATPEPGQTCSSSTKSLGSPASACN